MALDAVTIELLAKELEKELIDTRIDKIFMPSKEEVLLNIRSKASSFKLLISLRSGAARVGKTEQAFENPNVAPSFCMLLRKYITGGRVISVQAVFGERIILVKLQASNEIGDQQELTLAVELMGRYANLVLISPIGKIIDALKRIDFEASEVRQLLPGLTYILPPAQCKKYFLDFDLPCIVDELSDLDLLPIDGILKTIGGIGPIFAREAVYRSSLPEKQLNLLCPEEKERFEISFSEMFSDFASANKYFLVKKNNEPFEFTFYTPTQYENLTEFTVFEYDSLSVLIDDYYAQKDKAIRLRQKGQDLHRTVQNLYERALRKQDSRLSELKDTEKCEQYRLYGELINANLHKIAKGERLCKLQNYYDDTTAEISLDPRMSAIQNSQRYYKLYRKKQTAIKMLHILIEQGKTEISYLNTVVYEIGNAENEAALNDIRAELQSEGYIKSYKSKDKKQKPADFIRYRSSDGFLILVGRNNAQNEKLTMKAARARDMWFHVKNTSGSHTVVVSEGEAIPVTTQNEAAMLALHHSSMQGGVKVAVDYTFIKNIKKTGDLKLGMVIYDNYETAFVTTQEGLPEKLKVD